MPSSQGQQMSDLASDLGGDNRAVPQKIAWLNRFLEKSWVNRGPSLHFPQWLCCFWRESKLRGLAQCPTPGPTCASASLADPWQIERNLGHHRSSPPNTSKYTCLTIQMGTRTTQSGKTEHLAEFSQHGNQQKPWPSTQNKNLYISPSPPVLPSNRRRILVGLRWVWIRHPKKNPAASS